VDARGALGRDVVLERSRDTVAQVVADQLLAGDRSYGDRGGGPGGGWGGAGGGEGVLGAGRGGPGAHGRQSQRGGSYEQEPPAGP